MAKFLIDENISPKTLHFLTELKFDVTTLKSQGITDEEVVAQAIKEERIIITLDLDFGEIFHFHKRGKVGIIVLRVAPPTIENVNTMLKRLLSSVDIDKHKKSLIIVDWHKYRIRK